MITWIVERDVFNSDHFEKMCSHIEQSHILHTIRVRPFVHDIEGKVPHVSGPVVCYGSIGVAKLATKHGWNPGIFTDAETFTYEAYNGALSDLMLNPDAEVMRLSEVMDKTQGRLERFFIKPNDDNKAFAGLVEPRDSFESWLAGLREIGYLDDTDLEVVVSKPKELAMEWRSVVVDGQIIESSIYRQWQRVMPERNRNDDVDALIMEAHSRFQPAPVYVIDVVQTHDGLKVVEYNTFNSAGFYAMDIPNIVDAVSQYVDSHY